MEIIEIKNYINDYFETTNLNNVPAKEAVLPELAEMKIYSDFIVGTSSADDPIYTTEFKKSEVIHPEHKAPKEFLPNAKTVISFFLAFDDFVIDSNKEKVDIPFDSSIKNQRCSSAWLHARIEGQKLVEDLCVKLADYLKGQGYDAVVPFLSPGYAIVDKGRISNWSERHVAYASGLGTFGLSRGLITKKGTAGRFGSVVTNAFIVPTERPYKTPFEYCIMCGACQTKCPAEALDKTKGVIEGKNMDICQEYVLGSHLIPWGESKTERYGCGKCQVKVPCEHQIPDKK